MKTCICLAHGNADVERSLSENNRAVTCGRTTLSDGSINGLRTIKDAIKVIGLGQVHKMPVTPALLKAQRSSDIDYTAQKQEERERESRIEN